ncbi:hypothetical protein BKA70DRAFT_1433938 [Coprinopsis sp. MPI-PUGE-AT-0042]|nr:hypothetical protein BKA70DRAFT_1433938 [Coprinopsis sp. MPI-PUGE-AT-0042]
MDFEVYDTIALWRGSVHLQCLRFESCCGSSHFLRRLPLKQTSQEAAWIPDIKLHFQGNTYPSTMTSYPDLVNLHLHVVKQRPPRKPAIYQAFHHPLHPENNPGRTFVVLMRTSLQAMEDMRNFEEHLSVPGGQREALDAAGLLQLVPGDYLFARDTLGSGRPEEDTVLVWVVGSDKYSEEDKANMQAATLRALGPEETRTPTSVQFERLKETKTFDKDQSTRVYTIAQSLEQSRGIVAPCANGKWKEGGSEYHSTVKSLTRAVSRLAMANMAFAPAGVQAALREHANALNLPAIGCSGNYAYGTIQANIAHASDKEEDLSSDLGEFGQAHRDSHDAFGYYSNMLANSQLPASYDPGYFHLVFLGVYCRLDQFLGFNFQGHWRHGGTPPRCPPQLDLAPHAVRFVTISYPPGKMMSGSSRVRLAEFPVKNKPGPDALYITPEMREARFNKEVIMRNRSANFMADAHVFMDPSSYCNTAARHFYNEIRFRINQSPQYVGLNINPAKFFEAITYSSGGETHSTSNWEFALPSRHDDMISQATARVDNENERWRSYAAKAASVVPWCFAKSKDVQQWSAERRREADLDDVEMDGGVDGAESLLCPPALPTNEAELNKQSGKEGQGASIQGEAGRGSNDDIVTSSPISNPEAPAGGEDGSRSPVCDPFEPPLSKGGCDSVASDESSAEEDEEQAEKERKEALKRKAKATRDKRKRDKEKEDSNGSGGQAEDGEPPKKRANADPVHGK